MCGTDLFLGLLSILFPPIGVWVKRGICSADSIINIALCCLGFLPGLIHAWYIIYKYPDSYEYSAVSTSEDANGNGGHGTVTYYYVQQGSAPPRAKPHPQGGQKQNGGYGTLPNSAPNAQFPGQHAGTGNAFPQAAAPASGPSAPQAPQNSSGPSSGPAAGSSDAAPPPSYADVIKGDHKIQSRD